jgi:hypothetical protein
MACGEAACTACIAASTRSGARRSRKKGGSFLELVDGAGLERPKANAPLHLDGRWIEVDCLWRDRGLIVELDGRAAHGTARAFERDRGRDRALQVAGWRVVRITWRQLRFEAAIVVDDLRRLLAAAA